MRFLRSIKNKSLLAARGIGRILRRPKYALLAIVIAFLFSTLVFYIINIDFYGSLLFSRLSLGDKFTLLGSMISIMAVEWLTTTNGVLLFVVAILQGMAIALLVYTFKRNRKDSKEQTAQQIGSSGIAAIAAAVGLGCVPCGTSLLLPIVTIFFSGSAAASAVSVASIVILVVALLLSIFSLYQVGYIAYIHTETEKEVGSAKKRTR